MNDIEKLWWDQQNLGENHFGWVIPNVEAGGRLNRWFSAPPKIKNFIITYIWAGA